MKDDVKEILFDIEREEAQRQMNLEQYGSQLPEFGEVYVCDDCKKQLATDIRILPKPKFCPFCKKEHTVNRTQIRASNEARV